MSIFISFWVHLKDICSAVYTLDHSSKHTPVNVHLGGLMCAPKFEYMMYIKVETEEY